MDNERALTSERGGVTGRDFLFQVLQFLEEERLTTVARKFEQETRIFLSLQYVEDLINTGKWGELEDYLTSYTRLTDNRYSLKAFFEIRKQKFLEALDSEDLYREMTMLLTMDNFRENDKLSNYVDTRSARLLLVHEIKKLIESNPLLTDKLAFPQMPPARLRSLINLGLANSKRAVSNASEATPHALAAPDGSANGMQGFQGTGSAAMGGMPPPPQQAARRPAPADASGDADAGKNAAKRQRVDQRNTPPLASASQGAPAAPAAPAAPRPGPEVQRPAVDITNFPTTPSRTLAVLAPVTSMEFHNQQETELLVGHANGSVTLWDLAEPSGGDQLLMEQPFSSRFKCSNPSVTKVTWGPDCSFFGVCFNSGVFQVWILSTEAKQGIHLDVEAHSGPVRDLAFTVLQGNGQLSVVTGGEDGFVKVWNARRGDPVHSFHHQSPVNCVCPGYKSRINYVFANYRDGNIKVWLLLPDQGSSATMSPVYQAPGRYVTSMRYSVDMSRMFSAGVGAQGESSLVEWNEAEGTVVNRFRGFQNAEAAEAKLVVVGGNVLVLADGRTIKAWNADAREAGEGAAPVVVVQLDASFPPNPVIDVNPRGTVMAAADGASVRVFCNRDSVATIGAGDNAERAARALRLLPPVALPLVAGASASCFDALLPLEDGPDGAKGEVVAITFLSSGSGLIALHADGQHKLWRWTPPTGGPNSTPPPATAGPCPSAAIWRPQSGIAMRNEMLPAPAGQAPYACMALSRNDSYLLSCSGEKVAVFNLLTFKIMTKFKPVSNASAAPLALAFQPGDNNIVAIGLSDGVVHVFNVRLAEVKLVLPGHKGPVRALCYCANKTLASSGEDNQITVWGYEEGGVCMHSFQAVAAERLAQQPALGHAPLVLSPHAVRARVLAAHQSQLAVFRTNRSLRVAEWLVPVDAPALIGAAYTCDCHAVVAASADGTVRVFEADSLQLQVTLGPSAPALAGALPLVFSAHPKDPTVFAVGYNSGEVSVFAPRRRQGAKPSWHAFATQLAGGGEGEAADEEMGEGEGGGGGGATAGREGGAGTSGDKAGGAKGGPDGPLSREWGATDVRARSGGSGDSEMTAEEAAAAAAAAAAAQKERTSPGS